MNNRTRIQKLLKDDMAVRCHHYAPSMLPSEPCHDGQRAEHHNTERELSEARETGSTVAAIGIAGEDTRPVLDLVTRIAHVVAVVAQVARRTVPLGSDATFEAAYVLDAVLGAVYVGAVLRLDVRGVEAIEPLAALERCAGIGRIAHVALNC